jgi:hypothetical protein
MAIAAGNAGGWRCPEPSYESSLSADKTTMHRVMEMAKAPPA